MRDESTDVREKAYRQATALIPPSCRSFLRITHGYLLRLMHRGDDIAANPYIAEGLTGRTKINEHLYWHASTRDGPEWATDYLSAPVCDWTAQEIDFVDWVFNSAAVLRERACLMEQHEGLTCPKRW